MQYQYLNSDYFCIYQRQGNDRNGNPIYIVNFFKKFHTKDNKSDYYNINSSVPNQKIDKHGNIKIKSYNIHNDVLKLFNKIQ